MKEFKKEFKRLEMIVRCSSQKDDLLNFMKMPQTSKGRLNCLLCAYDPIENPKCSGYDPIIAYKWMNANYDSLKGE